MVGAPWSHVRRSRLAATQARRGFLAIVGGTGAAQVIVVLTLPLLTRLYDPHDMALYGVVVGVSGFIASFASLRLETAIPLPHDERDSRHLLWMCIASSATMSLLVVVAVRIFPEASRRIWPEGDLGAWVYATALLSLVIASVAAMVQMAIRLRSYSVIGRLTLVQGLATVLAQLVLSTAAWGGGLIWGSLAGRMTGLSTIVRKTLLQSREVPSPRQAGRLLRRFWRFPVLFAPTAAVNVLGSQLAMLVFPSMFGVAAAGMYALATRVAAIPGSLIGAAAQQVYIGELARTTSGEPAIRLFFRWSKVLGSLGLLSGLAFWFVMPALVPWIFGAEWEGAGPYIMYLGVMTSCGLLGSVMQGTWTVYQSGIATVAWDVGRLAAMAIALYLASVWQSSAEEAVALLALAGTAAYVVSWLGCWATVRFRARPQDRGLADEVPAASA